MVARLRTWPGDRAAIKRPPDSRRFVDGILAELAARRYRPTAWARFAGRSLMRSVDQARIRPVAVAEVTALHVLAGRAGNIPWVSASWFLSVTHLGLLGHRSTLGWPNRLTLIRALLPAVTEGARWSATLAIATDFLDGRLARRAGSSAFGEFADPIADWIFWSWYALRWERSPWLRWVPITLFTTSAAGITVAYFRRARTVDYPRPMAMRYISAAVQILFTIRSLRSARR